MCFQRCACSACARTTCRRLRELQVGDGRRVSRRCLLHFTRWWKTPTSRSNIKICEMSPPVLGERPRNFSDFKCITNVLACLQDENVGAILRNINVEMHLEFKSNRYFRKMYTSSSLRDTSESLQNQCHNFDHLSLLNHHELSVCNSILCNLGGNTSSL